MHMLPPLQKPALLSLRVFQLTEMSGAALQHQLHDLGQPLLGFHPQKAEAMCP